MAYFLTGSEKQAGVGESNRNGPAAGLSYASCWCQLPPHKPPDADTLVKVGPDLGEVHSKSGFLFTAESWAMADRIPIIPYYHEGIPDCGSFEVWFADGRPSEFFYWDNNYGRASITRKMNQDQASVKPREPSPGPSATSSKHVCLTCEGSGWVCEEHQKSATHLGVERNAINRAIATCVAIECTFA
jgi:hypothetical protein